MPNYFPTLSSPQNSEERTERFIQELRHYFPRLTEQDVQVIRDANRKKDANNSEDDEE